MRALLAIGGLALAAVGVAAAKGRRKQVTAKSYKTTAAVHAQARALASEAFEDVVHVPPTANELRILEAVSLHEATFGYGWTGEAAGSNNMGAITAGSGWTGETFEHKDSRPTAEGTNVWYWTKFRSYPTALEGWQDLVRVLYVQRPKVRAAAATGDPRAVAGAMYDTGYYQGQGATRAARVGGYEQALVNALWEIDHFAGNQ